MVFALVGVTEYHSLQKCGAMCKRAGICINDDTRCRQLLTATQSTMTRQKQRTLRSGVLTSANSLSSVTRSRQTSRQQTRVRVARVAAPARQTQPTPRVQNTRPVIPKRSTSQHPTTRPKQPKHWHSASRVPRPPQPRASSFKCATSRRGAATAPKQQSLSTPASQRASTSSQYVEHRDALWQRYAAWFKHRDALWLRNAVLLCHLWRRGPSLRELQDEEQYYAGVVSPLPPRADRRAFRRAMHKRHAFRRAMHERNALRRPSALTSMRHFIAMHRAVVKHMSHAAWLKHRDALWRRNAGVASITNSCAPISSWSLTSRCSMIPVGHVLSQVDPADWQYDLQGSA